MSPAHPTRALSARLWLFFLANYFALAGLCAGFVPPTSLERSATGAFVAAVALSYPALYLLPALLPSLALAPLATRRVGRALPVLFVLLFGCIQVLFYADRRVHDIFGFHLNGFVWNLLVTPGGFESMGGGLDAELAAATIGAVVLGVEALLWYALGTLAGPLRRVHARPAVLACAVVLVLLSAGERIGYGVAGVTGYHPVLALAEAFPFYQRTSLRSLAARFGVVAPRERGAALGVRDGTLVYPLAPVTLPAGAPKPNFLVLCAESLRADVLDPEIMPATWALAQRSSHFTAHVSGGNGTRMGVFSLFYGLPGSYWFEFLRRGRGPVLIDALAAAGYQVDAYTSDDFSYPEFDRTVFAALGSQQLHPALREGVAKKPSWQRDREQVALLIDRLERRDRARPFFAYFFFESPHARYEFPPEAVIRRPYLESFNYVTANLERDMPGIRNRYLNSVHHLDTQIARILDYLEQSGLADDTVVVVTGDHGEAFLEHGRWGHNSDFTEEQIRVPFVLHVPGRPPERIERLTSHLDVPATLLELAGSHAPASDYAFGGSLLDGGGEPWTLVSDWRRVVYVDPAGKASFPMRLTAFFDQQVDDRHDRPVADPEAFLRERQAEFRDVLGELRRFARGPGRGVHTASVERP